MLGNYLTEVVLLGFFMAVGVDVAARVSCGFINFTNIFLSVRTCYAVGKVVCDLQMKLDSALGVFVLALGLWGWGDACIDAGFLALITY